MRKLTFITAHLKEKMIDKVLFHIAFIIILNCVPSSSHLKATIIAPNHKMISSNTLPII